MEIEELGDQGVGLEVSSEDSSWLFPRQRWANVCA